MGTSEYRFEDGANREFLGVAHPEKLNYTSSYVISDVMSICHIIQHILERIRQITRHIFDANSINDV